MFTEQNTKPEFGGRNESLFNFPAKNGPDPKLNNFSKNAPSFFSAQGKKPAVPPGPGGALQNILKRSKNNQGAAPEEFDGYEMNNISEEQVNDQLMSAGYMTRLRS